MSPQYKPMSGTKMIGNPVKIDDEYIRHAAEAVGELSPEDFEKMPGLKIPTEAEDGELVKVILTGKAKDGFLADVVGAECDYEEAMEDEKPKGRIRIMISGGDNEEEN